MVPVLFTFNLQGVLKLNNYSGAKTLNMVYVVLEKNGEDQLDRSCENEEVLLRVNERRNILHEIIKREANWIGHILRRNCLQKKLLKEK